MAEDLKGLIQKIQEDGVLVAEKKSKDIEAEAKTHARDIIENAKKEAQSIIDNAKREIARMEKGGAESLKQSGRNLLLSLRGEINSTLDKIITADVRKSLSPDELVKIITLLIKTGKKEGEGDIVISLGKEDRQKVEKGLLAELKESLRESIALKTVGDIRGGFIISYDKGKSHYDFTDATLANYIAGFLKPKLAELLKESAKDLKRPSKK